MRAAWAIGCNGNVPLKRFVISIKKSHLLRDGFLFTGRIHGYGGSCLVWLPLTGRLNSSMLVCRSAAALHRCKRCGELCGIVAFDFFAADIRPH